MDYDCIHFINYDLCSNSANSELAKSKGKRFMVLQEPSEDEKLNISHLVMDFKLLWFSSNLQIQHIAKFTISIK